MRSKAAIREALKVERELHAALAENGVVYLYQWARRYGQWLVDVAKDQLPADEIKTQARLLAIEERLSALETPPTVYTESPAE